MEGLAKRLAALGVRKASTSSVNRYENPESARMPDADYVAGMAVLTGKPVAEVLFGPEWVGASEREVHERAEAFGKIEAIVLRVVGEVEGKDSTVRTDPSERIEEEKGATLPDD